MSTCRFYPEASVLGAGLLTVHFLMSRLPAQAESPTPAFLRDGVFTRLSGAKPRGPSRMPRAVALTPEPPCLLFLLPGLLSPLHLAGPFQL